MTEEILDMLEEARKEIADLKEAVKFLLCLAGEINDLTPSAEDEYERLIIKLDVNV